MKQLEFDEELIRQATMRAWIRNETGINPKSLNEGMTELQRAVDAFKKLTTFPEGRYGTAFDKTVHDTIRNMGDVRLDMAFAMVAQYSQILPRNVRLQVREVIEVMDQKAGTNQFDAEAVEDHIVEMLVKLDVLAHERILKEVKQMLPTSKFSIADIQVGNKLILSTHNSSYTDAIISIGKLSRIVLLGEKPATARECRLQPTSAQKAYGCVLMAAGEPIRWVNLYSNEKGLMSVDYKTPEDARKVAEALTE